MSCFSDRIIGTPPCVFEKDSNDPVDRLNIAADIFLASQDYLQAQHCAQQAIQLAERTDQKKKGCSLIRLAEVYRAYGQHQHAIGTYQRAADDFEMRGDDQGRVITLSYIIELHHDHQEWDQVTESCQLAMDLARRMEKLSNGDGNTEKGKEYQDWQDRFKKVREYALKQFDATGRSSPPPAAAFPASNPAGSTPGAATAPTPTAGTSPTQAQPSTPSIVGLEKQLADLQKQVKDDLARVSNHLKTLETQITDESDKVAQRLERDIGSLANRLTRLEQQIRDLISALQQIEKLQAAIWRLEEQTDKQLAGLATQVKDDSDKVAQSLKDVGNLESRTAAQVKQLADQLTRLEQQIGDASRALQQVGKLEATILGLEEQTGKQLAGIEATSDKVAQQLKDLHDLDSQTEIHIRRLATQLDELEKQSRDESAHLGNLDVYIQSIQTHTEIQVRQIANQLTALEKQVASELDRISQRLDKLDMRTPGPAGEQFKLITDRLAEVEEQSQSDLARVSQQLDSLAAQIREIGDRVIHQAEMMEKLSSGQPLLARSGRLAIPHKFSLKAIPVYNPIAAGKPKPVTDEILGYIEADELEYAGQALEVKPLKSTEITFVPDYDYAAAQVDGDSMDEAGILPGDYVLLQKAKVVPLNRESGDIVAVVFRNEGNDAAILKRYNRRNNRVTLKSESSNPKHTSKTYPAQYFEGDSPKISVVGIALAILRPVRQE
jgi:SOS-response transcriptional repressor LexA